jgi:hypothetical protein
MTLICDMIFDDDLLPIPIAKGIVITRTKDSSGDETIITNVPHAICHHSPTGYEFGYNGSGPADLALNCVQAILENTTGYKGEWMEIDGTLGWGAGRCYRDAWSLHQRFKTDFIAPIKQHVGTIITWHECAEWIKQQLNFLHELPEKKPKKEPNNVFPPFAIAVKRPT